MADLKKIYNRISDAQRFVIWTMALEAKKRNMPDKVMSAISRIDKIRNDRDKQAAVKLLRWAVSFGYPDVVEELLKRGADANTQRQFGDGVILDDAITGNQARIAELLLEHGASPNNVSRPWGYSSLHIAVSYNRADMARLLLKHGADMSIRDKQGRTPHEMARQMKAGITLRVLEEHISTGHATQVKNVYKSKRKKPVRQARRRHARWWKR